MVGLFFTGVKLGNGAAGACATPIKTIPEAVCCPSSAMAMPFPGKVRGRLAGDLAREALSGHGIRRAVGIATINALAECCWQRRPPPEIELRPSVDAFDATEIRRGDQVVWSACSSRSSRIEAARAVLSGAGAGPATLEPDELPFFRPAAEAAHRAAADVVLVTGSTWSMRRSRI